MARHTHVSLAKMDINRSAPDGTNALDTRKTFQLRLYLTGRGGHIVVYARQYWFAERNVRLSQCLSGKGERNWHALDGLSALNRGGTVQLRPCLRSM